MNNTYASIMGIAAAMTMTAPAYAGNGANKGTFASHAKKFRQAINRNPTAHVNAPGAMCLSARAISKDGLEYLVMDTNKDGKADQFNVYRSTSDGQGKQIFEFPKEDNKRNKRNKRIEKLCNYAKKVKMEGEMGWAKDFGELTKNYR